MIFQSKRDVFVSCVIWGAVLLLAVCGVHIVQQGGAERWLVLIVAMVISLLLWMWFGTYYEIEGQQLHYRSGPIKGTINIMEIRSITTKNTIFAGLKPSLASGGCIVGYNKFDEIYLSPKNMDLFIEELQKINSGIKVIV
ncbi:PH domain-containing protein [Mucilaginibacter terrae]|uniref:PH domain-containing protein n=1 Tax=Mucilaginibacter terrae TaxID=1955052 RepID=UPI00363A9932